MESSDFRDQLRRERAEQQDFADPATIKQFAFRVEKNSRSIQAGDRPAFFYVQNGVFLL